jgi:hypothetical protein
MRTTDRLLSMLDAELTLADLNSLPPAHRRRLASLLHHWWKLAEPPAKPVARAGEHASYDPGSFEGRHDFAPGTLNSLYVRKEGGSQ